MWHDHEAYFVRIAPHHVCSKTKIFWFGDNKVMAWEKASTFKEGASAALETTARLGR